MFIFLRSFYQDPKDLTPAVALVERSKIYPLNGKDTAKPMQFPDASGVPANMLPVSDGSAFDQLKQLVDSEGACWQQSASSRTSGSRPTLTRYILGFVDSKGVPLSGGSSYRLNFPQTSGR